MFKFKLKPETRQRIEKEEIEALRLYRLPDRWLARELIKIARAMRATTARFGPYDAVYDSTLLWHIVPEIAYRLGERQFLQDERATHEVRDLTNAGLRMVAGISWKNSSAFLYRNSDPGRMFFREPCNGNPVVYALDRLATPDEKDVLAKGILEVSRHRNVQSSGIWTPAMLSA